MNDLPRKRVAPLAPEERRAAIIAATLPLLRAEGLNVSTKKIAECAGVAEGTIFRVFPDKGALISAALAKAFDPASTIESIKAMASYEPELRFQIKTVLRVIAHRFKENMPLLMTLRASGLVMVDAYPDARQGLFDIVEALAELLRPNQHQLRLPVEKVAWLMISLVMARHRTEMLTEADLLTVVLDGVLYPGVKDADKTSAPPSAAI